MYIVRRGAGLVLAVIAGWLAWQGLQGVMVLTSRGSPLADALDAIVIWRIAAAGLAFLGGLMAAGNIRFGAILALLGSLGFAGLAIAFILAGTDSSLWMDEAIGAGALLAATAFLLFIRRG